MDDPHQRVITYLQTLVPTQKEHQNNRLKSNRTYEDQAG